MTTTTKPRIGDWMQTLTGRAFWPLDPRPEDVCIEDIAGALSRICRFGGHCREFYSVAQHSVLVSHLVPAEHARWALMHDAAEAYIGDVIRPIKIDTFLQTGEVPLHLVNGSVERRAMYSHFNEIERNVIRAIAQALDLPWPVPSETAAVVAMADDVALATEARDLLAPPPMPWRPGAEPYPHVVMPAPWHLAQHLFLERWNELRSGVNNLPERSLP